MNYMEEDKAVRNFIIVFVIVLLLVIGLYFFTTFLNKDNESKNTSDTNSNSSEETKVDDTIVIIGTMLQKADKDYYVLLYKSDDAKSYEYSSILSQYKMSTNSLPVYTVDLANALNSKYYDKENINLSASNVNDLRFGDITLLEVKDNKIVKSFDSLEKIKKEWKIS